MPAMPRIDGRRAQRHSAASLRRHPDQPLVWLFQRRSRRNLGQPRPCHKRHFARSSPRTASAASFASPTPRPRAVCSACSKRTATCHQSSTIVAFGSAEIVAHARQDETARRLLTVPGIGPITASLVVATVVDISVFKSARHFAAWLGLVPRQYSTGGKTRLGRITKTGNREIRKLRVLGATSMVYRAP